MAYWDRNPRSNQASRGQHMHHHEQQFPSDHYPEEHRQTQSQKLLQRSAEASKQMVFGVFGNVIRILEEFERRENEMIGQQLAMTQSNIPIPNQRDKSFEDIESIVTTQILLFEAQTKACRPEVLAEIKDELRRLTINWAAVRDEKGVQGVHKTDFYLAKLYEVLVKGSTQHATPDSSCVDQQVMKDNFPLIMSGMHQKNQLDEQFRRDENLTAKAPETRTSEMSLDGAKRIAEAHGSTDMNAYLQQDLANIQSNTTSLR